MKLSIFVVFNVSEAHSETRAPRHEASIIVLYSLAIHSFQSPESID